MKYLRIIFNCPKKQSDYDLIPTWLLKGHVGVSVSTLTITNIVNLSLTSFQFHPILKESVIPPHFSRTLWHS